MNNPNVVNMTGRTYGRLTVLERSDNDKRGNAMWLCKCECGNVKAILGGSLRQGSTRSCGCMLSELSKRRMTELLTKHGFSGKKLYSVYRAMRERCEKQTCKSYGNYGGRGISVCDEWKNDRALFFEWALKNGYQEGLQIDRIDVNGDYSPTNCRWITPQQNMNNVRKNIRFEHNGEIHTLAEWSSISGLPYGTVYERYKAGKTPAEILKKEGNHGAENEPCDPAQAADVQL